MGTIKEIKPNTLSFSSLYLETMFGNTRLAIATGFPWEHEGNIFLVTNFHVVSGLHPETGQPIDPHGTTPDSMRVWLHQRDDLGRWESHTLELFDNQNRPLWREHNVFRSRVDVVAIKINIPDHLRIFPINKITFKDFRIAVAQDVFILGFPRGITSAGKFPIWKRGSVASEPEVDLDGLPKILIDSMTKEGMSGSPVIAQYVGIYSEDHENPQPFDWIGMGRKFLGIYSGRLPEQDEFQANLGIVWKESVISEIMVSGIRPD